MFKLRVSGVPSSTQLLPLHADILASLFTPEGQPYLLEVTSKDTTHMFGFSHSYHKEYKRTRQSFILSHGNPVYQGLSDWCSLFVSVNIHQVMFSMRELSGPLSILIEMVTYTSYCNEPFSLGVLQLLKVKKKKKSPRPQRDSCQRHSVNDFKLFWTLCVS